MRLAVCGFAEDESADAGMEEELGEKKLPRLATWECNTARNTMAVCRAAGAMARSAFCSRYCLGVTLPASACVPPPRSYDDTQMYIT